jgi:hypothetical protein
MAKNLDASAFVRSLMRKIFTDDYLSTKSFTKMECEHQTAIIDMLIYLFVFFVNVWVNIKLFYTVQQMPQWNDSNFISAVPFVNLIAMNEDSVKGFIISVFNSHHNKGKQQLDTPH